MKKSFLTIFLLAMTPGLKAESWPVLGSQPAALGGSFVGVAKGPLGQFWNPAGLAREDNTSGFQIPIGTRFEFTGGLLRDAHKLSNVASDYEKIQTAQKSSSSIDATGMAAFMQGVVALDSLNKEGKGVLMDLWGGLGIKIGRFALSVNHYTEVGGTPFIDIKNIGLGSVSAGSGGVTFSGVASTTTLVSAPTDPTNLNSANQIETAITAVGFTSIENIICGAAGCLGAQSGIVNADQFSNALVNLATTSLTTTDIANAAQTIADNASLAGPVISAIATGNNNPYTNNASNLSLRGASFTEIALGMGREFILPGFYVGANLKMIQGTVGFHRFEVLKKEAGGSDVLGDFDKSKKDSVRPALDVGVFFDVTKSVPFPFKPRLGLMARNINSPKFDQPDLAKAAGEPSNYTLDSQLRLGASLNPLNFWTIAADIDLTENKTPINGFKSRMAGIGTEINVFNRSWLNIPLRFGLNKNMAESNSKIAYAGGVGLNFLHLIIDLGGSISTDTEKYTDKSGKAQDVPSNASGHASISLLF